MTGRRCSKAIGLVSRSRIESWTKNKRWTMQNGTAVVVMEDGKRDERSRNRSSGSQQAN
jgi:hypothetical protein